MNIYAHRGNSGFFPENTMYAFKKSLDLGIYGIEIDVQKTKDGILVVHHDETLGRMFDGKGSIKKSTFEQLRELNLKDEELKNKATSMYIETGKKFYRKDFIKPIADRLMEYYKQFCAEGFAPFTEKYNSLCLNIDQEVKTVGREEIEGTALGINSEGCLMIKDSTGKIHDVFTGEVSLRKKDNSYI